LINLEIEIHVSRGLPCVTAGQPSVFVFCVAFCSLHVLVTCLSSSVGAYQTVSGQRRRRFLCCALPFTSFTCFSSSVGVTEKRVSSPCVAFCSSHMLITCLSNSVGATEKKVSVLCVAFHFLHLLIKQCRGNGDEGFIPMRCLLFSARDHHMLIKQCRGFSSSVGATEMKVSSLCVAFCSPHAIITCLSNSGGAYQTVSGQRRCGYLPSALPFVLRMCSSLASQAVSGQRRRRFLPYALPFTSFTCFSSSGGATEMKVSSFFVARARNAILPRKNIMIIVIFMVK